LLYFSKKDVNGTGFMEMRNGSAGKIIREKSIDY